MPQRVDGQINEKRTERQLELTAKAIQLNPNLAAAYRLRANALRFAGRVEEGLALVRRALELNPNDALTLNSYGNHLGTNGQLEEAITVGKLALRLNPLAGGNYYNNVGKAYYSAHDYESVLDPTQKCIALFPYIGCYQLLLSALVRLGQLNRARLTASVRLKESRTWAELPAV